MERTWVPEPTSRPHSSSPPLRHRSRHPRSRFVPASTRGGRRLFGSLGAWAPSWGCPTAGRQSSSFSSASARREGADDGASSVPSAARQRSSSRSSPASPLRGLDDSRRVVRGSPGGSRPPGGWPDSGALDTSDASSRLLSLRLRSFISLTCLPWGKLGPDGQPGQPGLPRDDYPNQQKR
jgi:hypothetical protein